MSKIPHFVFQLIKCIILHYSHYIYTTKRHRIAHKYVKWDVPIDSSISEWHQFFYAIIDQSESSIRVCCLCIVKKKKNCSHCFCSAKIFQKTKCSMCNSPLELPSVHFLCGHSFHQHCLESFAESEAECPTCTPENRKVMDMLRAQDQKRDLHDHFHRQVLIFLLQFELVKKQYCK